MTIEQNCDHENKSLEKNKKTKTNKLLLRNAPSDHVSKQWEQKQKNIKAKNEIKKYRDRIKRTPCLVKSDINKSLQ